MTIARRVLPPAVVAALLLSATGTAGAKTGGPPSTLQPKDAAAAQRLKQSRQAGDLLNAAIRHVEQGDGACRQPAPHFGPGTTTHEAPSQAWLDILAPLRRPATPEELQDPARALGAGGAETFSDYTRHVTTADGHQLTIVLGRHTNTYVAPSSHCLDLEHTYLVGLLKGKPRKVQSLALRSFSYRRHGIETMPPASAQPVEGVYLFQKGGGGGGVDVAFFKEHGLLSSSGGADVGATHSSSTVYGLVPDGVASVTLEYAKTVSRGKDYKPTVFPSAFTTTVPVNENVYSTTVPRSAPDAFPHRLVWHDATGAVVHVVPDLTS
ncbi:MAG TPA: hypothetical protein VI318_06500 [Baekduia sp.]